MFVQQINALNNYFGSALIEEATKREQKIQKVEKPQITIGFDES